MMSIVTTIEQAIHPFYLTCYVLGLGVYTPKPYLSIFYNVTVWSIYSYLFYYTVIVLKVEKWFLVASAIISTGIHFLGNITSIIMNLCQHKRLRKFIKRLAAVDDTLEELGTPKMYRKLHVCIKRVLVGWIVYSQIVNIADMMWWIYTMKNYWYMILPCVTNHLQHTNIFMILVFTTYLWYIGTIFDKLNEHMTCLAREHYDKEYTWRKIVVSTHRYIMYISNYKRVFRTTMHLHLELCQLARELNAMFETQMTVEMVAYLIILTRFFRYICTQIIIDKDELILSLIDWINMCIWVFLYMVSLFCLNYTCESVSAKANEMNAVLHRLTDPLQYADTRDEIYQFTLQITQHPLKFSGLGLFHFGNDFLRKIIMTIVSYVIIIIQMPSLSQAFKDF